MSRKKGRVKEKNKKLSVVEKSKKKKSCDKKSNWEKTTPILNNCDQEKRRAEKANEWNPQKLV